MAGSPKRDSSERENPNLKYGDWPVSRNPKRQDSEEKERR
jgi:hypothetical protein